MPQASFPVAEDLEDYITSLSIIEPALLTDLLTIMRLDIKTSSVKNEWEKRTGWKPFIADTIDKSRVFDPAGSEDNWAIRGGGRFLDFEGGLVSFTELRTGVTFDYAGTVQTINSDFRLWPYNAVLEEKPYTGIEFTGRRWGGMESVKVTGKWGYAATLPDDIWDACLQKGALLCHPQLALNVSGGLYAVKDLNSETRFGGGGVTPLSTEAKVWNDTFESVLRDYIRVAL